MCLSQERTIATNTYVSDLAERLKKIATARLGSEVYVEITSDHKSYFFETAWWAWIVVVLLCPLACIYALISNGSDCHVLTRTRRLRQTWVFSHKDDEQAQEELLNDIARTRPIDTYRYNPPARRAW